MLGLDVSCIDTRYPIQQVSTGLPHIIVPLTGLDALSSVKVSQDLYWELVNGTWAKNVMVFCPESHEEQNHLSVRMFSYFLGIPEDPATGSGNGCLAAYLARYRYFGSAEVDVRAEQGYEMGRPSLLYLKALDTGDSIKVSVGGRAVIIAGGEWTV